MGNRATLKLTPVVDHEGIEELTRLAGELETKINEVNELIQKIEGLSINVVIHQSLHRE